MLDKPSNTKLRKHFMLPGGKAQREPTKCERHVLTGTPRAKGDGTSPPGNVPCGMEREDTEERPV